MITLRLDQKIKQVTSHAAKNFTLTKSELIRESISEYLKKLKQPSAWEIGKDVFGKYSSGFEYLSSNRKKLVKSKIETKRQ
ncbi:MAG: CopG family transcriptional regulator [Candidatus Electrothrix sp. AX5]|nr:CopG family transcriptional regulator [Candidatus Electrothrix sp. AX5]